MNFQITYKDNRKSFILKFKLKYQFYENYNDSINKDDSKNNHFVKSKYDKKIKIKIFIIRRKYLHRKRDKMR